MRYGVSRYQSVTKTGLSSNRAVTHRRQPQAPNPPSAFRPTQEHGIKITIGPHDGVHVRNWYTFPVTPESIPIQTGATWNTRTTLQGGEMPGFAGKNLDVVAFSGRLEPPEFYLVGGVTNMPGVVPHAFDEDLLENLQNAALITGEPFRFADDNVSVVMQQGAYAGPNYLEAQAFVDLLEAAEKDGEVMRLLVGDNFGFNEPVFIESFNWKFEDPDPDVILYEISFKQHRELEPTTASTEPSKTRSAPKDSTYTTNQGDTLHSIAVHEWGKGGKWRYLLNLNRKVIADLWWYPTTPSESQADWKDKGTVGPKIPGRAGGFQISSKVSGNQGDWIGPDLPFRADVELRVGAPVKVGAGHIASGKPQQSRSTG